MIMITVNASYDVKPAKPIPTKVIYLSDCDQLKPLTHAPTIYFYKPISQELLKNAIENLKDSLSKALVTFYPLAGRLHWTNGGRVELHSNSMGALLLEAETDLKIDDFGDFAPTPEIRALIPSVDYTSTPIHEVPLLLVQLTHLACGGISLGVAVSHIVVDGQSALHFIAEWAKIARGEKSDDDQPFLDRTILQQNEQHQSLIALPKSQYADYYPLPLLVDQSDNWEERRKATSVIMLKLSKEQVEKLKNKANDQDDLIHKTSSQRPFSRFEAISAHIWKCLSKARQHKPEQETVLYVSVDFRNRVKPPLPPRYFGNTIIIKAVTAIVDDLQSKPLSYASRRIKEAIESVTDEYVRSYLVCVKNIPDVSVFRHFHTVGCSQGIFYGNPNLIITSWSGLPLYGANFGWGDEIFMGPGSLGYDGRIFLVPSLHGDGSFIVPLRLQLEHISPFQRYFYEDV